MVLLECTELSCCIICILCIVTEEHNIWFFEGEKSPGIPITSLAVVVCQMCGLCPAFWSNFDASPKDAPMHCNVIWRNLVICLISILYCLATHLECLLIHNIMNIPSCITLLLWPPSLLTWFVQQKTSEMDVALWWYKWLGLGISGF